MYCEYCGRKAAPNRLVCKHCGAPLPEETVTPAPQKNPAPTEDKGPLFAIALLVFCMVLLIVGVIAGWK